MMHDLHEFQNEHLEWLSHNFPNQQAHDALLGLTEEVGELAHAHLKAQQQIRGTSQEHRAAAVDAIGDIMIYLASYCNTNGYQLSGCLESAWGEVKDRDWIKYPETGKPFACGNFRGYGPYQYCTLDLNHGGDHEWSSHEL